MIRTRGRQQHSYSGRMRYEIRLELLGIERPTRLRQVVHGPFGREPKREPHVAELQVEVDESNALVGLRKADREIRGGQCLSGSALWPEDADHRAERHSRCE